MCQRHEGTEALGGELVRWLPQGAGTGRGHPSWELQDSGHGAHPGKGGSTVSLCKAGGWKRDTCLQTRLLNTVPSLKEEAEKLCPRKFVHLYLSTWTLNGKKRGNSRPHARLRLGLRLYTVPETCRKEINVKLASRHQNHKQRKKTLTSLTLKALCFKDYHEAS